VTGDETFWWYETVHLDPLGLASLASEQPSTGIDDRRLVAETLGNRYPDPLHRIAGAFELVQNPASVVCSLSPGRMYGRWATEWMARVGKGRLRWTHGALDRQASLGFVGSDVVSWRPGIGLRAADGLRHFLPRLGASGQARGGVSESRRLLELMD
jgi:hypothetical protein